MLGSLYLEHTRFNIQKLYSGKFLNILPTLSLKKQRFFIPKIPRIIAMFCADPVIRCMLYINLKYLVYALQFYHYACTVFVVVDMFLHTKITIPT